MKRTFATLLLTTVVILGFSLDLPTALKSALQKTLDYEIARLNLEKSELDYKKGTIEATNRKMELSAEQIYYVGVQNYRSSLKSIYSGLLNRIFDLLAAKISLEIAQVNLENAKENYETYKTLRAKGLVSDKDLKEAEISLREAENNLVTAQRNYEKAERDYRELFDVPAEQITFNLPDPAKIVTKEECFANLVSIKIAELKLKIAEYDRETLPTNTSEYELKAAELDYKSALLNYEDTRKTAEDSVNDAFVNLDLLHKNALIAQDKLNLYEEDFRNTQEKYRKGLISKKEYNAQRVSLLNARKNYYEALKSYYTSVINLLIDSGKDVTF